MPEPHSDPISAVSNLTKSEIGISDHYAPQQIQEDRPLLFFVSYAGLDSKLKDNLLARLLIRLKSHKTLRFKHWTDKDILIGGDWFAAIKQAMGHAILPSCLLALISCPAISFSRMNSPGFMRTSL